MTSLLPLMYLTIVVMVLCILALVIFNQIINKQNIESELYELQKKTRSKTADPSDYYSLGVIYLSKKLYDQAIIQFSYALKIWEKNDVNGISNLYNTIGFTYFESEQYDLSIYYYKQAICKSPNYVVALNNLGYSYEKKKMILEAIETYKEALTYDTDNITANEKIDLLTRRFKSRDDRI